MLITPPAVLSFPNLFTPRLALNAKPGDVAKYSCTLLFPKGTDLTVLKQAVSNALTERWGEKVQGWLKSSPPQLRIPFRRDPEKYDENKFDVFINVTAQADKSKPGIVDRYAGPDGKPAPLADHSKLYPGCFVRAALSVYTYDNSGNKGVAFGLQHIQWWADGERLDNRKSAEDAFTAEARPEGSLDSLDTGGGTGSKAENLNDLLG